MEDILIPLAGMATAIILSYPIIRVGVRYVERKIQPGASPDELVELREDLRVMHDRLDAIDSGDHRLSELEERVDFAERMLTQSREAPQVRHGD